MHVSHITSPCLHFKGIPAFGLPSPQPLILLRIHVIGPPPTLWLSTLSPSALLSILFLLTLARPLAMSSLLSSLSALDSPDTSGYFPSLLHKENLPSNTGAVTLAVSLQLPLTYT